jgi:uncharacterized repeat protein (TIGR01451 family)
MITLRLCAIRFKMRIFCLAAFACWCAAAATPAQAANNAASSAYGESINLDLLPLLGGGVTVASGPLPAINGGSPPGYALETTLASVNVTGSAGIGALLSTGLLTVEADSSEPASDQAHSHTEVDGTALGIAGLLNLGAKAIVSDASITGTCRSALAATGTTQITGATLGGLAALGLTIPPNPAPNTVLLDVLGIRVVLNEQSVSGNGATTATLAVNAVHVSLSNTILSLIGALSGDIVIAHSEATLTCGIAVETAAASLTMTGSPTPVTVGESLTYTLTAANAGPDAAGGVAVTDSLPPSVTLVSAIPSQGSCSGAATVTCNLGSIAAGANATVGLVVVPTQSGTLVNTATSVSSTTNPDPGNTSATVTLMVNPATVGATQAALSVTGSAPAVGMVGKQLTYSLMVSNAGPDSATGVIFSDQLPAGMAMVAATPSQGTCSGAASLNCVIGTVNAGAAVTIALTAVPAVPGTMIDHASVTSNVPDPTPASESVSITTMVDAASGGAGSADLSLTGAAAPNPILAGDVLTYTLKASNAGPNAVTDLTLTDTLPAGVNVIAAQPTQGTCSGTDTISCALGALADGATATVVITVLAEQAGSAIDTAAITSGTPDPNSANNSVTVTTTVNAPPSVPCTPGTNVLCIDDQPGDRRFEVVTHYATVESGGLAGAGNAVALSTLGFSHGGVFWFFNAVNPEMLVKVLNSCSLNQKFWVFYSAGTNVGLATTVTDTMTGKIRVYTNPDLTAAPPIEDTGAFDCTVTDLAAAAKPAAAAAGRPALAASTISRPAPGSEAAAACTTTATSLCISGRFEVSVAYSTSQNGGMSGMGQAKQLSTLGVDRGGIFWFFDQANPEMLIKVLDACSLEQTYWVFYSATTNVGLTVTVLDTVTGHSATYKNTDLTAAPPVQDTAALPCS